MFDFKNLTVEIIKREDQSLVGQVFDFGIEVGDKLVITVTNGTLPHPKWLHMQLPSSRLSATRHVLMVGLIIEILESPHALSFMRDLSDNLPEGEIPTIETGFTVSWEHPVMDLQLETTPYVFERKDDFPTTGFVALEVLAYYLVQSFAETKIRAVLEGIFIKYFTLMNPTTWSPFLSGKALPHSSIG